MLSMHAVPPTASRAATVPAFLPVPVPEANLRQQVVEWLGRRICAGEVEPGATLSMADLAAERSVSRSVMREAMGVLASLGMVSSRRRLGTVVQPMEEWELINADVIRWRLMSPDRAQQIVELSELRSAIEPAAAVLAAQRAGAEDRQELAACLDELLAAASEGDIPQFHRSDKEFHALVLRLGHNKMFGALHRLVEGMLEARYLEGLLPQRVDPQAVDWHRRLGEAIIAGEDEVAGESAQLIVTLSAIEMLEMARASDQ